MIPQQQALAQNFSTFISWAVTLQTDFHIGVISTEINEPEIPADYFNIYVTWVRLGFVAATLLGGPGILLYLIGGVVIPRRRALPGADYKALSPARF